MRKTKGRPKLFDEQEVLNLAMDYFWKHGYENSSLDDLLKAMGISKGSFYHMFGSKEALFSKCLQLYRKKQIDYLHSLKQEIGAKATMLKLVEMTLDELKTTGRLTGCLLMNSGKECYGRYEELSKQIKEEYLTMQSFFANALQEDIDKGVLKTSLSAQELSTRFMNTLNGLVLSVQAGATDEMVESIVKQLKEMVE